MEMGAGHSHLSMSLLCAPSPEARIKAIYVFPPHSVLRIFILALVGRERRGQDFGQQHALPTKPNGKIRGDRVGEIHRWPYSSLGRGAQWLMPQGPARQPIRRL